MHFPVQGPLYNKASNDKICHSTFNVTDFGSRLILANVISPEEPSSPWILLYLICNVTMCVVVGFQPGIQPQRFLSCPSVYRPEIRRWYSRAGIRWLPKKKLRWWDLHSRWISQILRSPNNPVIFRALCLSPVASYTYYVRLTLLF